MAIADLIPYLYRWLKPRYPDCLWEGDRHQAQIALTFDDGPHPLYTLPLLDVLAQYNIKATFFWLGSWVAQYPEIAQAVHTQGHWLGLHGYTHQPFIGQSCQQIRQSLQKTQEAIANACQLAPTQIIDVRPPYGICRRKTIQQLTAWGYRTVMWSVVPVDWTEPGVSLVKQRVLKNTQGGNIIVLHEGSSGGRDVAATTDAILAELTPNFQFITVNQMWQLQTCDQNPLL